MASFLNAKHIRIFDYPRLAQLLRDRIRAAAEKLATAAGAKVELIGKAHIRKEDVVASVDKSRGDHPRAWCMSFRPWKPARPTGPGQTYPKPTPGKCLHESHSTPPCASKVPTAQAWNGCCGIALARPSHWIVCARSTRNTRSMKASSRLPAAAPAGCFRGPKIIERPRAPIPPRAGISIATAGCWHPTHCCSQNSVRFRQKSSRQNDQILDYLAVLT